MLEMFRLHYSRLLLDLVAASETPRKRNPRNNRFGNFPTAKIGAHCYHSLRTLHTCAAASKNLQYQGFFNLRSCIKAFAWLAFCAVVLPIAHAAQPGKTSGPAVFPRLTTYALNRARLNLPADFAAPLDLLLISFQPEQQTQIQTWMPLAQGLQHTNFNFRWYRMPVSNRENFIFRWWDNASMRSDESDPETWPWIVPIYVDKDSFRHRLQILSEKQITVLLVNKQGKVLWRAEGPLTPDKRSALIAAVSAAT